MKPDWRVFAVAMLLVSGLAMIGRAQVPASDWISQIDILELRPFEISFRLTNRSDSILGDVQGQAILSDQFGRTIETLQIAPLLLRPGESETIVSQSRWEFQKTGVFLMEIALQASSGVLFSNSLAFRILPVQLPLAPPVDTFGEGLRTLYQQPVNWGLERLDVQSAWTVSHGQRRTQDVVIAVIDTGIDGSIPQLQNSLWANPGEIEGNGVDDDGNGYIDDVHGWDFRDGDNSSLHGSTLHWHGTFVAGILAAQPGELPIVGVAPGARLMDVRFLDSNNQFSSRDWSMFAAAIDYAVNNGADLINLSIYANNRPPAILEAAIGRAVQAGVVIIGIAGNTGQSSVLYPGRYGDVLAVSATTEDDVLADFSSYGPNVALCAPGEGITSFISGGGAATRSGTSFAAPHVTGTLALILSTYPALSAIQAVDVLMRSLTDLGAPGVDPSFGAGLVNAYEAVTN